MELPALECPERYTGLYVFDFGDHVAVGYTAEEIAILLSVEAYAAGTVYRIHRATPDGTMELIGISAAGLGKQEAMRFCRAVAAEARMDFERLLALAATTPPPCRVVARLVQQTDTELPHATAIAFAAVEADAVSHWLRDGGYAGGDRIEVSHGKDVAAGLVLKQAELRPVGVGPLRSREAVLAATHETVQR